MTGFKKIELSLADLLGEEYVEAVCTVNSMLSNKDQNTLMRIAKEKIDLFPEDFQQKCESLLEKIGSKCYESYKNSSQGAGTLSFDKALKKNMAPLTGMGFVRAGEDGRLYFIGKSEHYHATLGHNFPGFQLLENARKIGITNISHNNTRGHITRLLEREIIRIVNGLIPEDVEGLEKTINSKHPHVLNRVINLETGSLAMEAALKMMLARFYKLEGNTEEPKYQGKIPVFLVMADLQRGKQANYHGTTILAQMLRGMWPQLYEKTESSSIFKIEAVGINNIDDFKRAIDSYDNSHYKVAGFIHELVLMNYGGIKLLPEYVAQTHKICKERDIPVTIDEIQSCMWAPELFLFKEYGAKPDFLSVGKGFPGGEYPASKMVSTSQMDNLSQFGALVTNGQEELASLSYLITIAFAEANKDYTSEVGKYYHERLEKLQNNYPEKITKIEGDAHLSTIFFNTVKQTEKFVSYLNNECCIDISAQTYKADCPPVALTKIPLISTRKAVDFVVSKMQEALEKI